jgi:hypothetical protein
MHADPPAGVHGPEEVSQLSLFTNSGITAGRFSYVEIFKLDLQTSAHQVLLLARSPDGAYDEPFNNPVICGAIAAVGSTGPNDICFVLNWQIQSSFVIATNQPVRNV